VDDFFIQTAEHQQHVLCAEKAPPFLSSTAAQKLLFVGRANMVLSNPVTSGPLLSPDGSLSPPHAGPAFPPVPPAPPAVAASEPPLADSPLWARLHAVIAPPARISTLDVDHAVDCLRSELSARLWRRVFGQNGLYGHLQTLKRFVLASDGPFFTLFIEQVLPLLAQPTLSVHKGTKRYSIALYLTC
jgi:hypothetical protein